MSRAVAETGFTLVELLVVTAILTIITGLVLVNNNRFGGVILLENLAYDVALSVREAQVYGISVRQFGAGDFSVGYGMHFSASSPTTYILFADIDGDGLYDINQGETVESTTIERGFHIGKLCAPAGSDEDTCVEVDEIDILFKRPEPDAFISANGVSGVLSPGALMESVRILLKSPRDDSASVVVEATGQISKQ